MDVPHHTVYQPSPDLKDWVREMLWIESTAPRLQVLVPEANHTLVLRQSGSGSLDERPLGTALLSGLQPRVRIASHSADSSLLIVRFTEFGSAALIRERADLLFGRTLDLDSVIAHAAVEGLQSRLAEAVSLQQKFAAVEGFLRTRISPTAKPSARLAATVGIIQRAGGSVPIPALAREVGMSQSALERHFKAIVGASPKAFGRIVRLNRVCHLWERGLSLTQIAHDAGYADQPHLIRDFRAFTGVNPTEFFRSGLPRNSPIFHK